MYLYGSNIKQMKLPDFYNTIKPIILKDDLAEFLGAPEDGVIEMNYLDVVKMAGHSCVTVAGAYIMTFKGLKALYGLELPKRGEIKVELRDAAADGSIGVSGTVFSNITGAAGDSGFGGLAGRFARRGLLFFSTDIDGFVRFTRTDTAKSVVVKYKPANVVHSGNIMMSALGPQATDESRKAFPKQWQEMIKTLFENIDEVVELS